MTLRFAPVLFAIAASACGADELLALGSQCQLASDCDAPLVCRYERCRRDCNEARDCAAGLRCFIDPEGLGACQLPEERMCDVSSCPAGLVCNSNIMECSIACAEDVDCQRGERCDTTGATPSCRPITAAPGCELTSDCEEPLVCIDNACVAECAANDQCAFADQVCVSFAGEACAGMPCACRYPCTSTADCPNAGTECIDCPSGASCATLEDGTPAMRYCERVASAP
jgi:hypothetical protein